MGDGSSFEGTFEDGEICGQGLRTWPDGSTYSGQFRRGEFCGQGIYRGADGTTYEGEFLDNKRHGDGELTMPDGSVFRGHFDGHRRHGHGEFTTKNGDVFKGEFVMNVFAEGTCDYANGSSYKGQIQNFQRHGEGVFSDATSGLVFRGQFANNVRQSWPSQARAVVDDIEEGLAVEQGQSIASFDVQVCNRVKLEGEEAAAAAAAAAGGKKGKSKGKKKGGSAPTEDIYELRPETSEDGRKFSLHICVAVPDPDDAAAEPTLRRIAAIDPSTPGGADVAEPVQPKEEQANDDNAESKEDDEVERDPFEDLAGAQTVDVFTQEGVAQIPAIQVLASTPPGSYVLLVVDTTPQLAEDNRLKDVQIPLAVTAAPEST